MIDLHVHSSLSDGTDPPDQIAKLAAAAGCAAVALTDHDCLDGVAAARDQGSLLGLEVIGGTELSCMFEPGGLHMLVYFVEAGEGPLQDELVVLQQIRDQRNRAIAERLTSMGIAITYEEILEEAGGVGAGRPHIAALLIERGIVSTFHEAFDKYLAKGKPAYIEKENLTPGRAIELARGSGGVASLAHPHTLGLENAAFDAAIAELTDLGLSGIEAMYSRYSPDQRDHLIEVANRHDLVATGGSDFHGAYKPELSIGVGEGDLDVPDEVLEQLKDRRPV